MMICSVLTYSGRIFGAVSAQDVIACIAYQIMRCVSYVQAVIAGRRRHHNKVFAECWLQGLTRERERAWWQRRLVVSVRDLSICDIFFGGGEREGG